MVALVIAHGPLHGADQAPVVGCVEPGADGHLPLGLQPVDFHFADVARLKASDGACAAALARRDEGDHLRVDEIGVAVVEGG
ncbi:hypothetical protein SDC9_98666 [bioreactor metagenome]|uniref:Uncharacterized protein n=1 Tax=bioreactor metagenome TaxID=1076179 RepID=A0A645AQN8_9ZZZZ